MNRRKAIGGSAKRGSHSHEKAPEGFDNILCELPRSKLRGIHLTKIQQP